jgi:hypothetical protein
MVVKKLLGNFKCGGDDFIAAAIIATAVHFWRTYFWQKKGG